MPEEQKSIMPKESKTMKKAQTVITKFQVEPLEWELSNNPRAVAAKLNELLEELNKYNFLTAKEIE